MNNVVRLPIARPLVRAECEPGGWNAQRPCRFASCTWNSATLSTRRTSRPQVGVCVLDVAEEPHTLEEVGEVLGVSREDVRQVQEKALDKLRRRGVGIRDLQALSEHTFEHARHPLERLGEA